MNISSVTSVIVGSFINSTIRVFVLNRKSHARDFISNILLGSGFVRKYYSFVNTPFFSKTDMAKPI